MKAVILEKKDGYAAALKDDGTIVRMRDNNYTIGDVIMMNDKKPLLSKKWGTLVAALLIFAMVGTTTMVNAAESYEVWVGDEKLNEDIGFIVDRRGNVTAVLDGEGEDIATYKDLIDLRLEEALLILAEDIESNIDNFYIVATSEDDEDAERFIERLRERIEERASEDDDEEVSEKPEKDEIPGNIEAITNEMVKEAKEEGIAPGKMNIINKLLAADDADEIDLDTAYNTKGELIKIAQDNPKDLMKIYSESKGNKNGAKFQENDEDDEDKIGNGKENAPGQNKDKTNVEPDDLDTDLDDESGRPENPGNSNGNNGKGGN